MLRPPSPTSSQGTQCSSSCARSVAPSLSCSALVASRPHLTSLPSKGAAALSFTCRSFLAALPNTSPSAAGCCHADQVKQGVASIATTIGSDNMLKFGKFYGTLNSCLCLVGLTHLCTDKAQYLRMSFPSLKAWLWKATLPFSLHHLMLLRIVGFVFYCSSWVVVASFMRFFVFLLQLHLLY